jgi:hypothetical protein
MHWQRRSACFAVIFVAACSASGNHNHSLPPPVKVRGVLEVVDGLAGSTPTPVSGRVTFSYDAGEGSIQSTPARADGTFSVSVNPGEFVVSAKSPRYGAGIDICRVPGLVKVRANMPPIIVSCKVNARG